MQSPARPAGLLALGSSQSATQPCSGACASVAAELLGLAASLSPCKRRHLDFKPAVPQPSQGAHGDSGQRVGNGALWPVC